MDNIFEQMTNDELLENFDCYTKELRRKGVCSKQPLRANLDKYCEAYSSNPIVSMEMDLMYAISNRWADNHRVSPEHR